MKDIGKQIIDKLVKNSMKSAMKLLGTVSTDTLDPELAIQVSSLLGDFKTFESESRIGIIDSRDKSVREA